MRENNTATAKPDVCRMKCGVCRRPICTGARTLYPAKPARRTKRRTLCAAPKN